MTSTIGVKKIQYPNGTNSITIDSSGSADITTANITTAAITTANVTNATATGTITTPSINGGQIGGRRNIIINGAMQVAQRGTSFSLSGTADTFITDRFLISNSDTGAWTASQSTDAPTGFSNSLKMDCTTADTSPTFLSLMTRFEGQDLQHLKKGTSSAEKTTLSFFVKSNKTGTYIAELRDIDNNRTIGKAYTISSADTWEQKIITFDGDTTGAFGNDNGNSLTVHFYLAVGSTYNSGTLATSWGSRVNANTAVGQVNLADSTNNEWYLTGVQLEVGSQATAFEHRSFGEELALCQRYYTVIVDGSVSNPSCFGIGTYYSSSNSYGSLELPTEMRTAPTIDLATGGDWFVMYRNGGSDGFQDITLSTATTRSIEFYNQTQANGIAGQSGFFRSINAGAKFAVVAEL